MIAIKRIVAFLLCVCMLLPLASCDREELATTTASSETKEMTPEELAAANEAALKEFIRKYRGGEYRDQELFLYEDFSRYYQLPDYKGMKYPFDSTVDTAVTDAEIEQYMILMLLTNVVPDSDYTTLTDGIVQKYDVVIIDYKGVIDGEEHSNATDTDAELLIGSNQFIPGFETGLAGVSVGSEVTLNLKFSPYYADANVAGKDAVFTVTVKKIQRPKIPEFTVETFEKLSQRDFADLDAVRKQIRENLVEKKKNVAYSALAQYLQKELLAQGTLLSYPEKEVKFYYSQFVDYYTAQRPAGMSMEDYCQSYLGMSYQEFEKVATAFAEETVADALALLAIAKKEKLTCTDEQLESFIVQDYQSVSAYYATLQEYLDDYAKLYGVNYFENQVIAAAVLEFVVDHATKIS